MSTDTKYKYAVVRIPENSVVEFFTLLVSKGYSDVSFVASLAQCNLRDDPNDDQPTTSNSVKETVNDEDSNSENNKSSPPRRQSSGSQPQSVSSRPTLATGAIKTENFDSWTPTAPSSNPTPDLLSASVPTELLTNLFAKNNGTEPKKPIFGFQASGVDFDLSNNEWHDNLKMSNGHSSTEKFHPYSSGSQKNDSPLQTRMKGWQREYIKEVIKNSHYPTEDELRDIELKCDLSRKQILRFIAKRLTNPNRKPRINHHDEKRKEQEERDSLGDQEDELQESDVSHLHHILSSLQETTA
ncbi:hypothetical protein L5515_012011 [Caenorhabditis briggsae]|nr:hypothetical protein L3Y34_004914 [Caenorhabditis briggsae]UMM29869.1 hypothetical protein L5515_012011 [Caenorhabditis briggsae]